jgi:TP901 family phage tail tape measure protein
MAQAFNLTAQLNLRGPSNVRQIVSDVKKQLGTITGDIKFNIDPASINNTSRLSKSLQELNANLANVSTNARAASSAIKSFGQSVTSISGSSNKLSSNLDKTTKSADNVGSSLTKTAKNVSVARTEMEEFGRQSALAVRRFAAFSAVTGVFFSLNRAINNGLKSFIEFDKELVKLQQVTGKNAEGLQDLQNEITRLSINLGVSSDSLVQVSSTLAQAGLSATETRAALEALARSSLAPSFDDINQTVEGSIALMRQFGISAKELEKALGSVNSVAAAFAVESSDIIAAIQRTGGVFANASKGVSEGTDALNEFIAVFTSVRATTRESAETIATGLRTIFTRIQRQGTIDALRDFGVTLTDAEGKFVGAYKAVQLLSEGLNRIDPRDIKFSQIVEELGGFRQIGKVIPLIQQFATAQEALKVAQAGQGSLAADALKAQLSLANQIAKVREEFLSLIRSLGQSDTFQTLARGALGFASGLIKITSALKGVLPALAILGAGASLRGITQFAGGFIGGLKKVPKGQEGEEQPGIARSIGSNLGSSLVGAKTEQTSRDIEKNTEALNGISDKLTSLTTTIQSLIDLSSKEKEQVIDPSLVTNLISSISTLNDTINNQKLTSTDSGQDPTQRKIQAQQIRNIRTDKTLNSTEKKIRIQQIQNEKNKSSGIDTTAIQELSAGINTFNTNFNAISNSLSTYNTTLQNNTNTLSSNNSSLENVYAALVNLDATLDRKDFGGGGGPTTASGGGRILGFSKGGSVPGNGRGDKVPALLEPGEVVMSNRAVNKYGRGNLVRMNRYAKGDQVRKIVPQNNTLNKSHIGSDIQISKKNLQNYARNYRSKEFFASAYDNAGVTKQQLESGDFDFNNLIKKMQLRIKDRVILNLPSNWNQALRANNPNLVSQNDLANFIATSEDSLFVGQYGRLPKNDKKDTRQQLVTAIKSLPTKQYTNKNNPPPSEFPSISSFDIDSELDSLKRIITQDNLEESSYIDLLFKPSKFGSSYVSGATGLQRTRTQSRSGAYKELLNSGGLIKKFAGGGEALQSKLSTIRTLLGEFYGSDEQLISKSISNSMIIDEARADKIIANLESSRSQLPLFKKLFSEKSSSVGVLNGFPVARYDAIGGLQSMRFDELKDEETIREFIKRGKLATQASRGPVGKRIVYGDQKAARRRFAVGGTVQGIAAEEKKSIETVILEQLSSFGDASGVKKILGLGAGDREAGAILNAGNIKAGKNIEKAIRYINRALAKTGKADAAKEAKEAAMRKVAIAGLFPLDYNKDFSDWKLEDGREIYGYVRGFQSSFLPQIEAMQEANRATRQKFAEDIQDTAALGGLGNRNIQGPIQPLAIDFDETLALGTKMLDENGKEDLPAYANREKVMKSLAQARPTSLAKRLASIEQKNPGYVRMFSRILTARPQSTADIIASTLNRFGLPYLEQDVTGVSQGLGTNIAKAKAANVAAAEKLIDDSEENIRATMAAGKSTFRYGEVPELKGPAEEKFGQSNIEGGMLEAALSQLLGYNINVDALQRNRAIDFPQGLGRGAQLFGLPPNIETEVKRTLDGDSFSKAREEFSRYFTENPQAYAKGGAATFGSGSFKFPKRISNAYVREMEKLLEQEQMEKVFSTYPGNERMIVDEEAVQKGYESPFSRELFINSFKDKISRNTVFERMGQFARVIGLPQTDFLSAIPTQLDFGVNYPATALFNKDPSGPGTRGLQGVDLTPYGYTEQDKQDLFGYTKLIEEKKKQILKTIKTSVTTYEDGSFGYDVALTEKLRAELEDLQKQQRSLIDKNNVAIKAAKESRLQSANQSGRGSVGIATNPFNTSQRQDYSILYHELTHQLFNSLRTKNAQSFEAYKAKVASLFSGNNDDVADAFDALVGNTGYNSADVAYGRSYKLSGLSSLMIGSAKKESFEKYVNSDPEYVPELRKTWAETQSTTNAKAFKPLNPRVNDILLRGKISQDVINKYEDNGKEEFLTTLVQKLPLLDENLRGILDSTLDDLLGGAGISRQKLSVGGLISKLKGGGSVPALVSNGEAFVPPKLAKQIGYGKLERMNQADKNGMTEFSEGGISVFKGPGNGTSDSIPTNLPVGSFVIREKATKALGLNSGGAVGVRKFKDGDKVSYRKHATGIQAPVPDLGFLKTSAILLADSFRTTEQIINNGYSAWQEIDKVAPVLANALDRYFSTINGTVEDASLMMQSYRAVAVSLAKQGKSAAEIDAIMTNYIDALNKGIDAYQNPTPTESPKSAAPSGPQIPPDPDNTSTTPKTSLPRTPPPVPKSAEQKLAAAENEAIAQRIETKQNIKSEYDPVYRGASSKEDKQAIQDDARSKFQAADATIQANKAAQQQAILQELLAQKAKEANQSTAEYISGLQQEIDARSVDIMEQDFSNALGPEAPSAPEARQQALNETISSRGLQAFNVPGLGEGTDLNSIIAQVSKNNDLAAEADKAKAAAATRAADALELMRLKAEQNGQTLSQYQSNLKQNILNLAKDLQKSAPGKISKFNETAVSLRGDINSGDEDKITKAKEQLAKQLADLGTNLESSQITTIIDDLAASMGDTDKTFVDIINNSQELQEAFKQSSTDATALQSATQKLSVSLGIPEEALQKLASSAELAASNLYDKNVAAAQKMASTLAKTSLAIGGIGSVISSTIKSLGGSENKDTAVLSTGISSVASTVSTLGASLSQLPGGIKFVLDTMQGMGGGIGKVATSLAPKIMGFIASPMALVGASLAGGAVAIAAGFKEAYNAAREFDLQTSQKRVDESLSRVSDLFAQFEKDTTNIDFLSKIDSELSYGSKQLMKNLETDLKVPKAMWANLLDLGGGSQAAGRSMILEKEGIGSYISSVFSNNAQQAAIGRIAPEKAVETAQKVQPQGQNILKQFENKLRSGMDMDTILAELNAAGNQSAEVLARMNPKINEQIMLIENDRNISEQRKSAIIKEITTSEANRVASVNMKNSMKQIEFEKLGRQTNNFATSLERMFNGMEQAINKTDFELSKLSRSAELSAAALSGNAKAGDVMLDSINVLQNPRAYSGQEQGAAFDQAAGFFGSQADLVRPLLGLGDKLESTVMSTINRSVQANPTGSTEGIASNIRNALDAQLKDLGLPPNIADKLAGQTKLAFEKIRSERGGEDTRLNFDQITEEVPAFAKAISSAQRAQELAVKAMEFYQKNLNEYAQAMNQMVDFQIEANNRMRKASEVQAKGAMELAKTLGQTVSLTETRNVTEAPIRSMTGGLTNPGDIGRNVVNLEAQRRTLQTAADNAGNRGPAAKDEFAVMQNRLRNTNVALRENIDALKQMADSTDLAQAALAKIQEVQARRQAGANLIEKMVTSNPEELARLNASIGRLNNNMRGGLNVGSTAEQRGESLQAFNMLAPLLGDGQQQNELKANVLESMLKESGVGIDSTFQSVLDSLRNPEGDPQMAEAISVYRESLAKQTQANDILGELQRMMSENTAEIAATKLATAISSVPLTFDQQVFNDIRDNIQKLVEIVGKRDEEGKDPIPAQNKRKGGVIYASMGRAIDFAPKGTDTVPAMLTPGEFVVNRAATKANLPLLQNINSKKYSNGGKVRYYNEGGYVLAGGVATAGTGKDDDAPKLQEAVSQSTEKQKTAKNAEQATKLKLPILEQYGDKDFKKLGTIQTDNFIAVGNRGKSGIGESFERIYLGEKIGTLYNNYGSITGTKKAELPKYQKSLFWGIQDIDSIIGSEKQLTKSDIYKNGKDGEFTDLILGYQSLYTKLMEGPSGNTKIETFIKEINTEPLPNISPNFSRKPKRRTRRDGDYKGYSYLKVVEDLIQDNEKSYWGIFDEIPRILKQGGVGFEGVSPFTLADSPAKFAAYVNTPPRVLAGKDLQQDNLDSHNKVDLVNNTIQVIQKTRQALKALSLFDDKILDPGEGAGEKVDTSTVESDASIYNKETLASLDALYKNRIFHTSIGDPDFVKKPITLYNMAEEKWNTIQSDPNYQKAVEDNTAMSNWNDTISIIPIVNNQPNTDNKRQFPWITNDTKLDVSNLKLAQKEFNTEAGDALFKVTETPIGSAGGRFFIPAKTITGNLLNTTSRNYGSPYEYTYIPPKAGDPKLNPLYNTEKPILYAGTSLNEYLGARLPSWNTDTGEMPPVNEEFGSLSSLKLNGQYIGGISSVDPSEFRVIKDLPEDIKPYIIPSSDGTNPILESMTIDATEYQKARDERIKAKEMELTKERASKVTGDRFKKLSTAESAFTTATRTKLAQEIQRIASTTLSAYGIGVPSITKIEDVGGVAGYLNNYLKKIDNKSPQWAEINAWRALFSELYQPGGIGKDAESRIPATVAYLKTFGVDVEKGTVDADGIKQIIAREKAIAISKNASGEIPEDSLKSLDLEASKTKLYTVDKDGNKTEIKSDNIKNPKTIQDVERIGLAPENLFENSEKRQSYLKVLSDYFTKNNLSEFAAAAEGLKPWYTAQDTLLNAGLNNDMLQGSLDALNGNAPKPNTTAGGDRNLEDPVTTIGNKDNYIQHHKLLTADKYGELPDTNRMKDLITVRIQESKTEEQKPENQQALARGGIVYASNGSFINFRPKGTDTVPAMLTPGEFVINRASTQKYRPVLEAINNGNYSRGGIVNYLSGGGYLPLYREGGGGTPAGSGFDFTSFMNNIMVSVSSSITEAFNKAVSALKQPNNSSGGVSNSGGDISSIDNFVNRLNNIANILSNIYIPPQITITGKHDVVVTINGDTVLNQLRPDMAGIAISAIRSAFQDLKAKNPENNTINFDIDINPNDIA